jgi:hypothetical protein
MWYGNSHEYITVAYTLLDVGIDWHVTLAYLSMTLLWNYHRLWVVKEPVWTNTCDIANTASINYLAAPARVTTVRYRKQNERAPWSIIKEWTTPTCIGVICNLRDSWLYVTRRGIHQQSTTHSVVNSQQKPALTNFLSGILKGPQPGFVCSGVWFVLRLDHQIDVGGSTKLSSLTFNIFTAAD